MPAFGSLGPLLDARLVVAVTGDPRQPRHLLHGLSEADVVAPRTRKPEGRHSYQQATRIEGVDLLPLETEVAEHARREVLQHRIALGDQPPEERKAVVGSEVEREAALVGVRAQIVRAPLPPRPLHSRGRAGGPHAIHPADRLDVDHVGAQRRERTRRDGAGPPRSEVEHANARERQLGIGHGVAGPGGRVRLDGAGVLAEARRGSRRRRVLVVHAPRPARHLERPRTRRRRRCHGRRSGRSRGCSRARVPARPGCATRWRGARSPRCVCCVVHAWTISFHSSQRCWRCTWLLRTRRSR